MTRSNPESLVEAVLKGESKAVARSLSLVEEGLSGSERCLELLYPHTGKATVIGVTGAPGAGKSTLVDALIREIRKDETKKVAVLAVDPSSPFSGGALLGDRIRMERSSAEKNVFVRSMASRGSLGGLGPRSADATFVLDAAGFDYIIVETVGVGQAEVDIVKIADAVIVVLVPGMGDGVQALKAGVLEIADVFALNKADYEGVDRLRKDIRQMLSLSRDDREKISPDIVDTIAIRDEGLSKLLQAVNNFCVKARKSGIARSRKRDFLVELLKQRIAAQVLAEVEVQMEAEKLTEEAAEAMLNRKRDPFSLAREIGERLIPVLSISRS